MLLSAGTRLGAYEITAALGAGGMGEVNRATDTKLGRDVAIKVLPSDFARDPQRLRFEREARVLASLNHPNIAAIYGFEQSESTPFLVLEYVPGLRPDFAVTADGQRFLMMAPLQESGAEPATVVLNWTAGVKR